MSKAKKDRIKDFYTSYRKKYGCYPTQSEIARGVVGSDGKKGVTRQAVYNYFTKNADVLKKIPEYRRYYVDKVNPAR